MKQFERITTDYVEAEDRVRMVGTLPGNEVVQAWITQRLLQRLVLALVQWLQKQGQKQGQGQGAEVRAPDALRTEVMQGFAQQAARARMTPQPPVRAAPGEAAWLVSSVDVAQHPQAVRLTFKGTRSGGAADAAVPEAVELGTLTLAPEPLRQWLNILFDNYRKAEWPLQAWPDWVSESAHTEPPGPVLMH